MGNKKEASKAFAPELNFADDAALGYSFRKKIERPGKTLLCCAWSLNATLSMHKVASEFSEA